MTSPSTQTGFSVLLLILHLFVTSTHAVPAPTDFHPAISDPAHIIPSSFKTTLKPRQGHQVNVFESYVGALYAATGWATRAYDDPTTGCVFGCGNEGVSIQPIMSQEESFTAKVGLWGLYSCAKAIRESSASQSELMEPKTCLLQMPAGNDVGQIIYKYGSDPWTEGDSPRPDLDGNVVVARNPAAEVDVSTEPLVLDGRSADANSTLASPPNPVIQCRVASKEDMRCWRDFEQRYWVNAKITRTSDIRLDRVKVLFTFLEVLLELTAQEPRPGFLPQDWSFDYTSAAEDVTISMRVPQDRPPASQEPEYRHAVEAFEAAFKAYQGGEVWKEADFYISTDISCVLSLSVKQA